MKISVIVPSYNQAAYLEKTLESILAQEGAIEIIVQDGGSTDGSVEILKRYGHKINWESKTDGGQAAAINAGVKKSSGDILCFLNSDDLWLPAALGYVRQAFVENPSATLVYGHADVIDEGGKILREYPTEKFSYGHLLKSCFICQPACFWRRSVYERWGGLDEKLNFNLDYEYWLRIGRSEIFLFMPQKLAQSRLHEHAKSVKNKIKIHLEALGMLERYSENGRPEINWLRGYARSCGDEKAGGFLKYANEYCRGLSEMQKRYRLTMGESAWILWKLWGSYKLGKRM